LLIIIVVAAVGAIGVGFASASPGSSGHPSSDLRSANPQTVCTIASEFVYEGVTLDKTVPAGPKALTAKNNALADEPGAAVVEEVLGRANSSSVPVVNGHDVVVLRLTNVAPVPIFGPPTDGPAVMSKPSCVIAVYDADSGDKLVEWQTLPLP
jgi:hypothetical protein